MLAAIVGVGLLTATPVRAVITRLTPLQSLLHDSTYIFTAKIESVDADKPAIVVVADEQLKGKASFDKMAILFKGDDEAKKRQHVPQLLRRIAPKLPLVLFAQPRDKGYLALAYTNGTWFQIVGVQVDGRVRWSLTHGEPYLRKTYKGSTADLRKVLVDSLSGKSEPPGVNAKEKPGFGPEVESEKKSDGGATHSSGPMLAVIPSVLVGGPLAILAMLFPAVFGGLTLVLRRWMVALSVLSLNSTLYVAQSWCMRWLAGSWWGTPAALWLTMMVVTLLGILWAWRRQVDLLAATDASGAIPSTSSHPGCTHITTMPVPVSPPHDAGPGRIEVMTLGLLSLGCLATLVFSLPHTLVGWDLWDKMLLMFSAGLGMATLHAFTLRWRSGRGGQVKPGLPGEGVLLWAMLLAGVGLGTTFGNVSSDVGATQDGAPYRVAWRFRPAVERCWMASSPVVDGDRVYIGVVFPSAFGGSGAVYGLDRVTGKELWMFNADGNMKDVFSSPCVADGRLYIGEGFHQHTSCKLYCLDATTGKALWDFPTGSHTESSPCVAGGKVYFGAGDDGLYCLDAATGKEKWHVKGLHVDANPLVVGGRLYGGSGVGDEYKETVLFCLNADTGAEYWRMPTDLPVWGMPALWGEHLYASLGNGNYLESADQPAGAVMCLEATTGQRVWRYDVRDGVHVRMSVDEKNVWFASRDQHCYCLDRKDGSLRWKTDLGSPVLASPFLAEGGNGASLYAVSGDGLMHCLDPNTGVVGWTFDVAQDARQKAMVFSSPTVIGRAGHKGESRWIYFGCGLNDFARGILYCLEEPARTGSP